MPFGIIYSITCNDTNDVYVGSTTTSLNKRMIGHHNNCKRYDEGKQKQGCSAFDIIRRNNYTVKPLETYEYEELKQLHLKEREYIAELKPVNTMRRPHASKEEKKETEKTIKSKPENKAKKAESDKKYRNGEHREDLLQRKREYHHANKEAIAEKKKAYRDANKEAIAERKRAEYEKAKEKGLCEQIICQCGGNYILRAKARHFKTKCHQAYVNN